MLIRSRAIVLNQLRYSDSVVIAHVLTETHGKLALFVRSGKTSKTGGKQRYFQALYVLELELDYKETREMQSLKEVRIIHALHEIASDFRKQSIAIFISEVLQKSIKPQQPDNQLFNFLYESVLQLETLESNVSIFHHYFLVQLMKYLGFLPGNQYSEDLPILDTESGLFVSIANINSACLNMQESKLVDVLSHGSMESLSQIKMDRQQRQQVLNAILFYYNHHVPGFENLKSYEILKTMFQ
jgi:DNA repair protein RecO (recombination protein O)